MGGRLPVSPLRINSLSLVTEKRFFYSGTHLTGRELGYFSALGGCFNGVELQFRLDPGQAGAFYNFTPKQWAGPEKVCAAYGKNPLRPVWETTVHDIHGRGPDDPLPENQVIRSDVVAFYDSPGPFVTATYRTREGWPMRLYAIQNFTAWIEGTDASGVFRRLCGVLAWHSVIHVGNENLEHPHNAPRYSKMAGTVAGTGWVSTDTMPPI